MTSVRCGPFKVRSGKVCKIAHKADARIADRSQTFEAPADHFINEGSIQITQTSVKGKKVAVHLESIRRELRQIETPTGEVLVTSVPVSFVVRVYAETGSGLTSKAVTAWAEAAVRYTVTEHLSSPVTS
jgi:hypothetical protein